MSSTVKERNTIQGFGPGIVSSEVKSHANDPAVLRQVKKAQETLKRVGFPGQKKVSESKPSQE